MTFPLSLNIFYNKTCYFGKSTDHRMENENSLSIIAFPINPFANLQRVYTIDEIFPHFLDAFQIRCASRIYFILSSLFKKILNHILLH